MLCKLKTSNQTTIKTIQTTTFVIGVISLILGILMERQLVEEQTALLRFSGMLCGFGSAITILGGILFLRNKFSSKDKKKAREIAQTDERNITISRICFTAMAVASFFLFTVMAFVFCYQGFWFGTIISTICMYLESIVGLITYKIISNKM